MQLDVGWDNLRNGNCSRNPFLFLKFVVITYYINLSSRHDCLTVDHGNSEHSLVDVDQKRTKYLPK